MPSIRIDCDAASAETTDPDPGDEFTLDEPPEIPIYEGNYFGANGWWVTEMSGSTTVHRPIESWTVEDVAAFVRGTSGARVSKKMSKKSTKVAQPEVCNSSCLIHRLSLLSSDCELVRFFCQCD